MELEVAASSSSEQAAAAADTMVVCALVPVVPWSSPPWSLTGASTATARMHQDMHGAERVLVDSSLQPCYLGLAWVRPSTLSSSAG
mmetsp:Transcript_5388/g.13313  ORF Transcript_5388/g.13313 Transcript_5388/m.13313 type:complete len:86 (-) Transcript_5388:87-344(-)